ncbi:hypothetical protein FJT64_027949 [Amphibalanus amphitrite]|uniref:Fibrinogen C-terminal domain-containing protein n=1 Tax=Amphibalanus amphitrite TaxID=1232801 RepID=A0A6A4VWR0_AMPAM|nr:hypothetical protein FJT64_027949 [Amphibalanus amphitrite]
MSPHSAVALLLLGLLLGLGAAVPLQDSADIPPDGSQPVVAARGGFYLPPAGTAAPTAASTDPLLHRLQPLLERALARAVESLLAAGRRTEGDQLAALRARLESLEREMAELRRDAPPPTQPGAVQCSQTEPEAAETTPAPRQEPAPTPEPEPEPCLSEPDPLAAELAPFERPEKLSCARSCLQLRDQMHNPQDGVYWFTGMTVPVLCDFSHDGGGWTLLLTAKSREGWNLLSVLGRRERSPSLDDNYSILEHADYIRDLGTGTRFAYRIETQAEKSRQRWGGVWFAPQNYSFVHENPDQTEVFNVKRFDKWTYKANGIKRRMPWLNMHVRGSGNEPAVLTTGDASTNVWGTLLNDEGKTTYQHSPWIHPEAQQSGTVLYWMRENSR